MTTDAEAALARGNQFAQDGNHARAIEQFEIAIDAGLTGEGHLNIGNSLDELGQHSDAANSYRKAAEHGEDSAWLNLARTLSILDEDSPAVAAFVQASRVGDPKALTGLAVHLREQGETEWARNLLRQAAKQPDAKIMADAVMACFTWEDAHDPSVEEALEAGQEFYPFAEQCLEEIRQTRRDVK